MDTENDEILATLLQDEENNRLSYTPQQISYHVNESSPKSTSVNMSEISEHFSNDTLTNEGISIVDHINKTYFKELQHFVPTDYLDENECVKVVSVNNEGFEIGLGKELYRFDFEERASSFHSFLLSFFETLKEAEVDRDYDQLLLAERKVKCRLGKHILKTGPRSAEVIISNDNDFIEDTDSYDSHSAHHNQKRNQKKFKINPLVLKKLIEAKKRKENAVYYIVVSNTNHKDRKILQCHSGPPSSISDLCRLASHRFNLKGKKSFTRVWKGHIELHDQHLSNPDSPIISPGDILLFSSGSGLTSKIT